MTFSARLATAAIASLLLTGAAFAQTAPAAPAKTDTPAATTAAPTDKKPRSAASLECSKEADAQNLHGRKERHKFMRKCNKDAAAKAAQ